MAPFNLSNTTGNKAKLSISDLTGNISSATPDYIELDIELLQEYNNQPFKLYDEDKLNDLVESIKQSGIIQPVIVRPIPDSNKYEILAGHNRTHASRLAGLSKIKCIIMSDISDAQASLIMINSNLCQRTKMLTSELAYSYKIQKDNLKSMGFKSVDSMIAEEYNNKVRTIQRYIRIAEELDRKLIDMIDDKRLIFAAAYQFTYLSKDNQDVLYSYINDNPKIKINNEQAQLIVKTISSGTLDYETLDNVLKAEKDEQIKLSYFELEKYVSDVPKEKIPTLISYILENSADVIEKWVKNN